MAKKPSKNQLDLDILLNNIKNKFNLSTDEIIELLTQKPDEISLPISIFNSKLGMLESASLYLKDKKGLSFKQIASFLKRDYKTIWTSYNKAKSKTKNKK